MQIKKDKKQLNVAIPIDIYNWLKSEAKKDSRSMANFLIVKLRELKGLSGCK